MVTSDAFVWFVYGWGNLDSIPELNVNWFDVPIITGMVSMTVQCFFAWRIWKLGQSKLSSFLAGFIVFVRSFITGFVFSLSFSAFKAHDVEMYLSFFSFLCFKVLLLLVQESRFDDHHISNYYIHLSNISSRYRSRYLAHFRKSMT
jgi:hypothetical protein